MKRYVEQLLEDIEFAQNRALEKLAVWKSMNTEESIDDFVEPKTDEGIMMYDLFELQQFFLPDESYLDDEEVRELATAIIQLWRAHNLYPVFTKHLPRRIKYSLLRDYWNQMVYPNPEERTDIELCDYSVCPYCVNCPVCGHKNGNGKATA
jgi:hypothetical protein